MIKGWSAQLPANSVVAVVGGIVVVVVALVVVVVASLVVVTGSEVVVVTLVDVVVSGWVVVVGSACWGLQAAIISKTAGMTRRISGKLTACSVSLKRTEAVAGFGEEPWQQVNWESDDREGATDDGLDEQATRALKRISTSLVHGFPG